MGIVHQLPGRGVLGVRGGVDHSHHLEEGPVGALLDDVLVVGRPTSCGLRFEGVCAKGIKAHGQV